MKYRQITLACVSFCQPTMSSSSRAGTRHLVDSRRPNLPLERDKAHEAPASHRQAHDMPQIHPRRNIKCQVVIQALTEVSQAPSAKCQVVIQALTEVSQAPSAKPSFKH